MMWIVVSVIVVAALFVLAKLAFKALHGEKNPHEQAQFLLGDSSPEEADVYATIGEPVTLQTDWKEPPFAITVLDSPEAVDEITVRLPVRITCIIPRWSYDDVGPILAFLQTDSSENDRPVQWVAEWDDPSHLLREGSFRGVVLALGGTHDGFLYFKAEDESPDQTVPEQPFVALQYLDGSEEMILVDLTSRIQPPAKAEFSRNAPTVQTYVHKIMKQLRDSGQWEQAVVPPAAKIGDTLQVTPNPGSPWLKMVVLSSPEQISESLAHLRVRITGQARGKERYTYFHLQISTKPDINGRIHHLWESAFIEPDNPRLLDSLHGISLKRGKSAEGYVYFRPEDDADGTVPDQPFTTLCYGPRLLELPVDLTDNS